MKADADGLAGSGRSAVARRGRLRGRPSRRDHRGVGARARAVRTGRRPCRGGRRSGSRRDAPAPGHRADGAGARLARPGGTPARGSGGDARARVARGRPRVRADADRRRPGRSAVVRARHRGGLGVRRCGVRRRTSGGSSAAHPGRRCRGRTGAARRSGSGGGLRGPRSALDRARVLRARLRPAGTRAVRRRRGVDRGDGAVVPDECHREPPWALPRAPRGDPEVARGVRRGGARGAGGLRGAEPVPAPGDGMAAQRARTDPAAQGRHRRRRGGPPGRASRRVGAPAGSRAGASGAGRVGRGGRRHTRRAGASLAGSFEGAATGHRPAAGAAARRAGGDRDRGRRPRPSPCRGRRAGAGGRPIPEQGTGRRGDPGSGTGAARGGRRGGGGTVLLGSRTTVERDRGAL